MPQGRYRARPPLAEDSEVRERGLENSPAPPPSGRSSPPPNYILLRRHSMPACCMVAASIGPLSAGVDARASTSCSNQTPCCGFWSRAHDEAVRGAATYSTPGSHHEQPSILLQ